MRKRAAILLVAAVAAASFAVSASAVAGASVSGKGAAVCAGKTKSQAIKQIKTAYDYFLNGAKGYTAEQKAAYLEYLSGKKLDPAFLAAFTASFEKNAATAGTTAVAIDKVVCKGKNGADVTYTLVLGGTRAEGLAPPGAAVLEGKTWKVTGLTQCNLLALDPSAGDVLGTEPCATIVVKEKR
ncbi:MAG: hypothetical protein MUP97_17985 [Acidimicrobiia bacterium]|jgi:hypothetical protein|nr:hypothetical protein [Acidimicrobiia bacterium]